MIDNIFDVLLKRTESILRSQNDFDFVLDYYRSFKDIMDIKTKPENERSSTEVAKLNRVNKIYEVLSFINDDDRLRADFYLTIIENNKDFVTLSGLKNLQLPKNNIN